MWLSANTTQTYWQEEAHHLPHPHYQHPHHYRPHTHIHRQSSSHTQRSVCVQQQQRRRRHHCRSASVGRFADFTFQFRAKRGSGWSAPSAKRQTAEIRKSKRNQTQLSKKFSKIKHTKFKLEKIAKINKKKKNKT